MYYTKFNEPVSHEHGPKDSEATMLHSIRNVVYILGMSLDDNEGNLIFSDIVITVLQWMFPPELLVLHF